MAMSQPLSLCIVVVILMNVLRAMEDEGLYPPIEPFTTGFLQVSDIHSIYYEQSGNADGIPVLFIHGGPGGDSSPRDRRYFDPNAFHIILFDQRGAGKSTPAFSLEENDTWSLVADMEKLREKLGINRWLLFGGSWGSTLALIYAETHIDRVLGLVVRGIFTLRDSELEWVYGKTGAAHLFPEAYTKFIEPIPLEERGNIVQAYYKRLSRADEEERMKCAQEWNRWELSISRVHLPEDHFKRMNSDVNWCLAHSRIETHYFVNGGFLKNNNQIWDNLHIIEESGVPVRIVQGRYDTVCPMTTAWELHKRLPKSELTVCGFAGHSAKDPDMAKKLVEACDELKTLIKK